MNKLLISELFFFCKRPLEIKYFFVLDLSLPYNLQDCVDNVDACTGQLLLAAYILLPMFGLEVKNTTKGNLNEAFI
jgi:hypothetical protein